jgi:phosphohistidine phosphatase
LSAILGRDTVSKQAMKRLFLLRHAKSSWDDAALTDHDRPLALRGRRAAPRIGEHMRGEGWIPDLVLCSTARRAVETLDLVLPRLGRSPPVRHLASLYLAPPSRILARLESLADDVGSVLVVGHNPGMETLARRLAAHGSKKARDQLSEKFPTAALAVLDLDVEAWADVAGAAGRLVEFVRPRQLK